MSCAAKQTNDINRGIPIQWLGDALTTGLVPQPGLPASAQRQIKPVQRLPAPKHSQLLPLEDRAASNALEDQADSRRKPFTDMLEDGGDLSRGTVAPLPSTANMAVRQTCASSVVTLLPESAQKQTAKLEDMLRCNAGRGSGQDGPDIVCFRVIDSRVHLKKRPLFGADNLKAGDLPVRIYRIHNMQGDGAWVSQSTDDLAVIRMFDVAETHVSDLMQSLWRWRLVPHDHSNQPSRDGFLLQRQGLVFACRPAAPFRLGQVDLQRGIKPTQLELYLELKRNGWSRGRGRPEGGLMFRANMQERERIYYQVSFFYFLCLLNIDEISERAEAELGLLHDQCQAYYQAAWQLAQDGQWSVLARMQPNRRATYYRTVAAIHVDLGSGATHAN